MAIRYVREHAEEFAVDPQKVLVVGFSAGGHLAAHAATYVGGLAEEIGDEIDGESYIPSAQILCYPVLDIDGHPGSFVNLIGSASPAHRKLSPKYIADKTTPPAFIWHTETDPCVDVSNTLRYGIKLHELGVSYEMHIYPLGGHGLGVGYHPDKNINEPYIQSWTSNLLAWLKLRGWLE